MYAVIYAPNCKEHYVSTNDLKGHTCYITTTQFFNKRHLDADFLFCIMISIVVSLCTFFFEHGCCSKLHEKLSNLCFVNEIG
jgi:hypothetical protein